MTPLSPRVSPRTTGGRRAGAIFFSIGRSEHETDVQAEQSPPQAEARIPGSNEDEERSSRSLCPPAQGAEETRGLSGTSSPLRAGPSTQDGRLRRRSDFQNAYRNGRRWGGRIVNVFVAANDLGHPRFGLTVTKKSGGAVVRNRLRRQIREIVRFLVPALPGVGRDVVIHVKPGIGSAVHRELRGEIERILTKALAGAAK